MRTFVDLLNNRTSVRKFTNRKVSPETLDTILNTIMNTATSTYNQQASIIRITSDELKAEISAISGQDFIKTAPELFIFIADSHRNISLIRELSIDIPERESNVDIFFQGFTDAVLLAQNAANLIDSFGLGSVFLGSILNDVEKLIHLLKLPHYTFPVLGLAFGHPAEINETKPRIPKEKRVFENKYIDNKSYIDDLRKYNEDVYKYYESRYPDKKIDFYKHVSSIYGRYNPTRNKLLDIARSNGYKI